MYKTKDFEFPKNLLPHFNQAKLLEWLSIFYLISIIILEFLVMGNIQTMKTVWLEDILSLTAPISFLITARIYTRAPNSQFPYGFHSSVKIAFLLGSAALMSIGLFLLIDSSFVLIKQEHPTIPYFTISNHSVWAGYLIIVVMLYKVIAPYFLGLFKIKLAKILHDKTLYVDGRTNRADWIAAVGAIFGIIGISWGWPWSDALVAILISISILKDGFINTKNAIFNLMDETPTKIGSQDIEPLITTILNYLKQLSWVEEVKLRIREDGHIYFGEALVVPKRTDNLVANIGGAIKEIHQFSWRIHDFLICPVDKMP
ncbi:cation diffusion facilitator family transporter [Legionella hackeliae]|uniref:Cation diffusion facilitator family transporter n=1 Tax=Legionella hackeliae TaxID=449 RepID=A0A0A8UTE2_LEGHA|nr:cation transporter [Legionella hackeliae]KTD06669.1 Cadmium, cobalt and zinc/H(+)-K(+) antiporter [Legionella hackeliae]CEK10791.1 Cation diffusion facilitator family transporter [Legionella hackeliae]STX47528.1 Cadmium, cobalt and zinc/H(+)-K(+) antiporter [Legionella hackeliae]